VALQFAGLGLLFLGLVWSCTSGISQSRGPTPRQDDSSGPRSLPTHAVSTHAVSTHAVSTHAIPTHAVSTHAVSTHAVSTHAEVEQLQFPFQFHSKAEVELHAVLPSAPASDAPSSPAISPDLPPSQVFPGAPGGAPVDAEIFQGEGFTQPDDVVTDEHKMARSASIDDGGDTDELNCEGAGDTGEVGPSRHASTAPLGADDEASIAPSQFMDRIDKLRSLARSKRGGKRGGKGSKFSRLPAYAMDVPDEAVEVLEDAGSPVDRDGIIDF